MIANEKPGICYPGFMPPLVYLETCPKIPAKIAAKILPGIGKLPPLFAAINRQNSVFKIVGFFTW